MWRLVQTYGKNEGEVHDAYPLIKNSTVHKANSQASETI